MSERKGAMTAKFLSQRYPEEIHWHMDHKDVGRLHWRRNYVLRLSLFSDVFREAVEERLDDGSSSVLLYMLYLKRQHW